MNKSILSFLILYMLAINLGTCLPILADEATQVAEDINKTEDDKKGE